MSRRSYRGLMSLPAWGLFGPNDELVATVRAHDAEEARAIFKREGLRGARVRRMPHSVVGCSNA